jgi:hypothetical protein
MTRGLPSENDRAKASESGQVEHEIGEASDNSKVKMMEPQRANSRE